MTCTYNGGGSALFYPDGIDSSGNVPKLILFVFLFFKLVN